uniref:Uncharacterized protein n=1 Tax=Phytophthora ramorum TaxID=164328 RepID=H3HB88_PHYRM
MPPPPPPPRAPPPPRPKVPQPPQAPTPGRGAPAPPRGAPPGPPKDPPPQPPKDAPPPLPVRSEPEKDLVAEAAASLAAIQKLLRRGRLSFTLLEARELRHKGGSVDARRFSADPYVKIVVGTNPLSALEKRSRTLKKSTTPVIFHEEVVSFDLTDPVALVTDGDLPIKIEVFDENLLSDELLGEVRVSALRFFDGQPHPCGELEIEVKLEEALVGMLSIVLMEGRNLKSMELIGKQDPYCQLSIGKFTKRGKTVERGGRNPYFGEEELLFWFGDDVWTQQMTLRVFDEDIGSDDLIGDAKFSVLHFMAHSGAQEHAISLRNKGSPAGDVLLRIEFFPAGVLTVTCHAAKQLRSVDAIGRQDPYVKLTLDGRATQMVRKTKTDTDGGSEPEWSGEPFHFDVVDQYSLQVEIWDEDSVGADDLIGAASLSLLPIFRYGYADDWLKLWVKGRFGNKDPAGMLRLEMSFEGPAGVAFPQHQIGMDRFTEKDRRTKDTAGVIPSASERNGGQDAAMAAKAHALTRPAKRVAENTSEFSEEELLGAFRFLDVDKNSFIGAAELRHLLICMGELITDAEVDEMVRLCDTDGDGQVSFDEFRRMAIHPDPGGPEFATVVAEAEPEEPVPANKQRQQEIKQEKTKLMRRFVEDTRPSLEMLERIAKKFRQMQHDALDFEDFCSLFEVEPTGEYRRLFALFTPDNQSDSGADLREILLAAVNFIGGVDRVQRVRFCFEIFDDDHNGFITEDELVNILRANYLATSDDQVRKKAQTILRQADDDGDGRAKHLMERLNTAQVKVKRLQRLEAALVDFFMEVMDRTGSNGGSNTSPRSLEAESTFARGKRKEQFLKKAEGDPISLLNGLRTHLRLKFAEQEAQEAAAERQALADSLNNQQNEQNTRDKFLQLELACKQLEDQQKCLMRQLNQGEHQMLLEKLNAQIQEERSQEIAAQQLITKQRQEIAALTEARDALIKAAQSQKSLDENQTLRRALRKYEIQMAQMEATNEERKREVQRLQQQLTGLRQSTQLQMYSRLEKESRHVRELADDLKSRLAESEADLLRTKGTLKERENQAQKMKDEYARLFTAVQKQKQPAHYSGSKMTRSSSSMHLSQLNHSQQLPPRMPGGATNGEHPYVVEYYRSEAARVERECEALKLQIRRMMASEQLHKQKTRVLRAERQNLVRERDQLRADLDRAKKHSTLQSVAMNRQQAHASVEPRKVGFSSAAQDVKHLQKRNAFLEERFRKALQSNSAFATI